MVLILLLGLRVPNIISTLNLIDTYSVALTFFVPTVKIRHYSIDLAEYYFDPEEFIGNFGITNFVARFCAVQIISSGGNIFTHPVSCCSRA